MEFALEGILETLLVGAITSLCLISPFFLVFGHMFRLGPMQHLFVFLLYERDEKVANRATAEVSESYHAFALFLLIAGLFGLGVLAESFSKIEELDLRYQLIRRSDKSIRLDSLEDVSRGVLATGNANRDFARFASDFIACRDLERRDEGAHKDRAPLCRAMSNKGGGFYYTAKNAVYKEETRFSELSRLQARIDFTRAISMSFGVLALIWFAAFFLAFFAEWQRDRIKNGSSGWRGELLQHWLSLSALRCLITGFAFLLVAYAVMFGWSDQEEYYDKRVFGYYLSNATDYGETKNEISLPKRKDYPESVFLPITSPDRNMHFEPSAVALLGRGMVVANDKSSDDPLIFFPLGLDRKVVDRGVALRLPGVLQRWGKIESLHYSGNDSAGILLAAGNFDHRFETASSIHRFEITIKQGMPILTEVSKLRLARNPCSVFPEGRCIIEGLASSNPEKEIFLGVRFRIQDKIKQPTFAIIRLTPNDYGEWVPTLWRESTLPQAYMHHGISALDMNEEGSLFVMTSVEGDYRQSNGVRLAMQTTEVMGTLWRVDADALGIDKPVALQPTALFSTPHKPEGVVMLDKSSALIVFDDDANRKGMATAPETFALEHFESVYAIAKIPSVAK